jgi:hypothetical protein
MATIDEHKQLTETVNAKLKQFLTIDLVNLTREIELGNQLSFKKGEVIFIKIIDLFKKVNDVNLFDVPYSLIVAFSGQLDHAISIFEQIKTFDPNTTNPASVRDSLVIQLEQQFDTYYSTAFPILTIGLLNSNNLSVEKAKLKDTLFELIKEKEAAKKESENLLTEIQDVLVKARQAALEVGVAQHYLIFKEESEEHKKLSDLWLARTVKVLVGIGIVGIVLLFIPPHDTATISLIQFTVTKIVLLSVLFYGLAICTRNYKAHKHNSILNKHRQNALNTFETFSKAAGSDIQTKSAVLLEATHTIFSNQQTGYLNNDNDSDSPNKIIEIFKNVSDKGQ